MDSEIPNGLAEQLVGILYKNTTLNYDVCAMNLVEVFQHLSINLPQFEDFNQSFVGSIETAITNPEINPDINKLKNNLENLHRLSNELKCGELNFYECNSIIEQCTEHCIQLLSKQTQANVFDKILRTSRDQILNLFGIWQLASNKTVKNNIIDLYNICSLTDPIVLRLLFENTNLASELCCKIKQDIELMDHVSLHKSCKCLILLITNNSRMQLSFVDFLKQDDFLQIIFDAIESEKDYLFINLISDKSGHRNLDDDYEDQKPKLTMIQIFIHLLLTINKKFMMPEENLLVNFINTNAETISNRKFLSEAVINLFNFETDPLIDYQINKGQLSNMTLNEDEGYYVNSILKFVSDLFSLSVTKYTTSIFYSNDFNVLIDVIIRKLNCLGPDDQIRVDYLSLVQLILQNSEYMETMYRRYDLNDCFDAVLSETDQHTIDQDIVRVIIKDFPALRN